MARSLARMGASRLPLYGIALLLLLGVVFASPARAVGASDQPGPAVEALEPFAVELRAEDLTALLRSRLDPSAPIADATIVISPGGVGVSGWLTGLITMPFEGDMALLAENGALRLDVRSVWMGFFNLPDGVVQGVEDYLAEKLDLDGSMRLAGMVEAREVVLGDGMARITGTQRPSGVISQELADWVFGAIAATEGRALPVLPGADLLPPGRAVTADGPDLYLALGDSLAVGLGAARVEDGYVPRFHAYLERQAGRDVALRNLGVSGETTTSMLASGQLDRALAEVRSRRDDGDPSTRVSMVTLNLGGNDLLRSLDAPACRKDPMGTDCRSRVDTALTQFDSNFARVLGALAAELEPGTGFYVLTAYNPFDLGINTPLEVLSRETSERMNALIRARAAEAGARVADPYELMRGNAGAWTHILRGDIHPNSDGYQVLAYALTAAVPPAAPQVVTAPAPDAQAVAAHVGDKADCPWRSLSHPAGEATVAAAQR